MIDAVLSLFRLARFAGTLSRNEAIFPALEDVGFSPLRMRVLRVACWPLRPFGVNGDPSLPPVTRALVALGPAYVKFGQSLATRPDIVGSDLTEMLRPLQDRLPAFSQAEARAAVEDQLRRPVDEIFEGFGPPIAAASIAQVHAATDRETGERVAVKILRPGIEKVFARDIAAFLLVARVLGFLRPGFRRLRAEAVVRNFRRSVTNEMNLLNEAALAVEFAENLRDDPGIRLAVPIWRLTAKRVLTSSWQEGTPIDDIPAMRRAGREPESAAADLLQLFLRCALRDGLFHADMHHGNLRIAPDGALVLLDFGIMGRLDGGTRRAYANILYGFHTKDYLRSARAHRDVGYLPPDQDVHAFAQSLRSIIEPIFGERASNISMGRVLAQLFSVTERFGMKTQTQLLLLQKTMAVVEGVARGLDPDLDIWEVSKPVVKEWVEENVGVRRARRDLKEAASVLVSLSPHLPTLAERLLTPSRPPDESGKLHRDSRFLQGAAVGAAAALIAALLLD